jgi:type IV pilus assembly protein PilA
MLTTSSKRLSRGEDGFTLIELMVVVLIIAILMAIAIPTFLGAQNKAKDRAAQANLKNVSTAVRTIAVDDLGLFTSVTAANLLAAEGGITTVAGVGTAAAVGFVVDTTVTPNILQLSKISASGTAYGIRLQSDGKTFYCKGVIGAVSALAAPTVCDATTKW